MEKKKNLRAVFLNCSIKKDGSKSNTKVLMDMLAERMKELDPNLETEYVYARDYNIEYGVENDLGGDDEWLKILEKIHAADIVIMGTPIWMGVRSSVMQQVIERLDGVTHGTKFDLQNGQFSLYNKVAGMVVTGNEDGAHDVIANTFANLAHFGATIPPNTDVYWVGDAGPGAAFVEAGGEYSPYVHRNIEFAAHNLLHAAETLRAHPYTVDYNIIKEKLVKRLMVKNKLMQEMKEKMKKAFEEMSTSETESL